MISIPKSRVFWGIFFISLCPLLNGLVVFERGDFEYQFSGVFKPEMFYGKNISLLNDNNECDKLWWARHTLDFNFGVKWGKETYGQGEGVVNFYCTIRDRGIWGNSNSIARTTQAESKVLEEVGRPHRHAIPRHIFWMREGWIEFDLGQLFGLCYANKHTLTLGAFSFELGRGISLGDAYAIGPELLGFYTDFIVDQYAFGGKFSGELIHDFLSYDLYTAILQNKSSGLGETCANVYGQQFGRINDPQRGFGIINFIIAGRMNLTVFDNDCGKLNIQPYGLYNRDPEQRLEFRGDASSKLGTIGLASEYYSDRFEFGFDYAFNVGHQSVKGWDRNEVRAQNREGVFTLVNSQVNVGSATGPNVVYDSRTQNGRRVQEIIDSTFEDEAYNGKKIGEDLNGVELFNSNRRFRNPYTNQYEGWMFVVDGSVYFCNKDLKLSAAAGVATGDRNPNDETIDAVYSGFIPLQSIYSGKRVKSAFLLGGAGRLVRPLSQPSAKAIHSLSRFGATNQGFTNLIYAGSGCTWTPSNFKRSFSFNPNILAYWEEMPSKRFDARLGRQIDEPASTYIGIETNVFIYYYPYDNLKTFLVGSIFFPGSHYADLKGRPFTPAQERALDRLDRTGNFEERIPNLGCDKAYTLNIGFEFKF